MSGATDQLTREGFSYLQRGEIREAELRFRSAIAANSSNANALHGLAIIAHQTGHFQPAIELFDRAIAADSSLAAAYVNRGNAQFALQRFDDAIESHRKALQLSPDLNSARINMASALQAVGRIDEAVAVIEQALQSAPDSAETHNNLGNLYKEQGRLQDAISCYTAALRLNPMLPQAASNRLAALKLDPTMSPSDILAAHREWSAWFEAVSTSAPVLTNKPEPTRKIRIGYVSPDCHGALPAFIDPVIAGHNRQRFDVYCYFNNPQSPESLATRGVASTSCTLKGATDEEVAKKIHADGIDILIDIAGHTGQNRLGVFARRPAPVQITWLDYLGTTGLAAMDYRLTDIVADPVGNENFHTEKLLRMPHTQWCWRPDENAPDVSLLPALKNSYITFGSFNNAIKLTDATLNLWRQLLIAIPSARLRVAGIAEGFARQRIIELLRVDQERLEFLPRVGVREYRESLGMVDIALDPLPFSGATTTLDALWQGVPVLTLSGATSCSRSSASLLTAVGLDDWIANDAEDWLQRAKRLCADVNALAQLRAGLRARAQSSALVDFKKFVGDLETHYAAVWKVWCKQRSPLDDALIAARLRLKKSERPDHQIDVLELDAATEALTKIIRARPNWEVAKQDAAQAYLAWSKFHPDAKAAWQKNIPATPSRTKVSVIICSIRPDNFAHIKARIESLFSHHDVEVIGIHDAKSLCEGYNRGTTMSRGDVLIFCHDDIEIVHDDFAARVLGHLQAHDLIGVAGTSRLVNSDWRHGGPSNVHGQIIHRPPNDASFVAANMSGYIYLGIGLQDSTIDSIQAVDGVFIATKRAVWEKLRFDQDTFDGFHLYDIDFSYRAFLAGYKLAIPLDLLLIHFSTGRYDQAWQKYNLKFLEKFPALINRPNINRLANINVKLKTLEQVERLHTGLLAHQFGVVESWSALPAETLSNPLDLEIAELVQTALSDANSRVLNELGKLYLRQGRLADAVRSFEEASHLDSRQHLSMSNKIAALRADPTISQDKLFALHREWSDRFEFHASSAPLLVNPPEPNRKLRVGYVSADPQHRLAAFIQPVLQSHDRREFEIFWFDDATHSSAATPGVVIRSLVGMDDDQAAKIIHQDGIDILIDLSGHGESHRMGLFARRVAPVQISWLGYQCDAGMNGIPYWIGDVTTEPANARNDRLLRLPNVSFCWQPNAGAAAVNAPPILSNGHITFGYFSEAARLSDTALSLWNRLLAAMPEARMVIAHVPAGFAQRRILTQLNCDASRIDFLSDVELLADENFLSRVDIVFDAMGLSDPLATLHAMWQGVPVLTLTGAASCSRAAASVLSNLGLNEWIAQDETQWLVLAQQHAANVTLLSTLRQSLRERLRMSTMLDAKKFTRDLEALYRNVWRDWCGARVAANASPTKYLGCDGAVIATKAALDSGRINEGVTIISAVLKTRPDWALAKMFAMGAYMGWAQTHREAKPAWHQIAPAKIKRTKVSAIVCSIRPDYFVGVKAALEAQFATHSFEIIGIHDAKSLAEGYNRGASKASGNVLIFCHDDIDFVQADFGTRVLHHLQTSDVIGVAGTSRLTGSAFMDSGYPDCCGQIIHARQDWRKPDSILSYFAPGIQGLVVEGIQALDGVFIAMHRRVWEAIKYDEAEFDGFHLYDVDFTYRAYLAGLRLMVPMDLLLVHFSDGAYSPTWQRYANRFLAKFPALDVPPNVLRGSPANVRLRSIQQIELLHTGLLHHRFGS
jgi:protein O-GlcNAc transferase